MRERGLVDTALTRASRRLQKKRNRRAACPLPGQGEGSGIEQREGRKRGSNAPCQGTGGEGFFTPAASVQNDEKNRGSSYVESVAEVADAGEDHREAVLVGGGDSRLFAGRVDGIDAGSGAATNRERTILSDKGDRVRLDVLGDADTEGECAHLGVGGSAFRH